MTAFLLDRIANLHDRALAELAPELPLEDRVLQVARRLDEAARWIDLTRADSDHPEDVALGRVQAHLVQAIEGVDALMTSTTSPATVLARGRGGTGRPADADGGIWVPSDHAPTGGLEPRSEASDPTDETPHPKEQHDAK